MTDPARIPLLCERLKKVWEHHPDLRLGQMMFLAGWDGVKERLFYMQDEELVSRIEQAEANRRKV